MKQPITIGDVMTPCPLSIRSNETLGAALRIMGTRNLRHLPVIDDEEVIGILTAREAHLSHELCSRVGECPATVADLNLKTPFVVYSDADISDVAQEMSERKEDCALVSDVGGNFVGILTSSDISRLLHLVLEETRATEEDGETSEVTL